MLDDRPYMRSPEYRTQWSATSILLIVNAVAFVLQEVHRVWFAALPINRYVAESPFALSLSGLAQGHLWQLISFQFMHGGLVHLLGNLLVIYFFGRAVEDTLGRTGFVKLYFASGTLGGLLQVSCGFLLPALFKYPVVGASAGAFGLVAAFAIMFPQREITLLLFFILPISMRAITLLWLSIALAVFGVVVPSDNVAHMAHLGGIMGGLAYVHWIVRGNLSFRLPQFRPRVVRRPRQLVRTAATKPSLWRQPKPPVEEELTPGEFISREVDPILDKISQHGIQSLTDRERQILEKARAKMAKR